MNSRHSALAIDYKHILLLDSLPVGVARPLKVIDAPFNLNPRLDSPQRILCRAMAIAGYLSLYHQGMILFVKYSDELLTNSDPS